LDDPPQQDWKPLVNRYQELLAELDAQSETGACGMAGQAEKR